MKIDKASRNSSKHSKVHTSGSDKLSGPSKNSFEAHIMRAETHAYNENLEELVDEILVQGRKLAGKTDIKELKLYKKLVSQFIDAAVEGSHQFTKQSLLDRRGRHKVYAVIKKINHEIELLTGEVMKNEQNNIRVLERLDIIKGLILDLTA